MKTVIITILLLISPLFMFSQGITFKIDTVHNTQDSVIVFIKEFLGPNLRRSYYSSFSDSVDSKFHYGFLWLKEGIIREYRLGRKWGYKEEDINSTIRDGDAEPVIWKRIK